MSEKSAGKKRTFTLVIFLIMVAVIIAYSVINPQITDSKETNDMIKVIVTRTAGAIVFFVLIFYLGYKNILKFSTGVKCVKYLAVIPFFLVVINNFPIIGVAAGNIEITAKEPLTWILFAAECLSIGLFEEFAFRGTMFLYILENRRKTTKEIFLVTALSSLIFGLVHLFNIAEGGGIGATFLQVGYSFLIGGMCAVALLLTKNLWICVILHTVFDFGGKFVPSLGDGKIWDTVTVVITAVLGVTVLAFALFMMSKVKPEDTDAFYAKTKKSEGETSETDRGE